MRRRKYVFQKNLQKELLTLKVRHWTRVVVLGIAAVLSSQITPLTLLRGYRMVGWFTPETIL